jgi:hypothetical protein
MANWSFRAREWFADRTNAQYPRLRPIRPSAPVRDFKFSEFVIVIKGLALAAVCLLVAIPLLFLCVMLVYAIFVGLRG